MHLVLYPKCVPCNPREVSSTCTSTLHSANNVTVHPKEDDEKVSSCGQECRRNHKIVMQLLNSPDFNVLDLGFFPSIQSLQYKAAPRNMEELIKFTVAAYDAYGPIKLYNKSSWKLQCRAAGGNRYKLPHSTNRSSVTVANLSPRSAVTLLHTI